MASESEKKPLGMVIPAVPRGVEIPPEPPDVAARTLSVSARLLAGATIFFFLAFAFAYFYLRSLDVEHMWRPAHVNPKGGLGAAMIICVALSALATIVAGRQVKAKNPAWKGPAIAGLLLGLVAVALQCVEYTAQKFGPTDGAFASVFCAWTGLYLIAVLGAMYWLETQVASALRAGRAPTQTTADSDIKDADRLISPGFDAAVFYWSFLAGIGVVMYVILYLL